QGTRPSALAERVGSPHQGHPTHLLRALEIAMAGETVITVVGNLVDDPELRFTPSGAAVANFRIASTPRTFDKQTNEWKDGDDPWAAAPAASGGSSASSSDPWASGPAAGGSEPPF